MSVFNQTGALHPGKTAFDLTHEKLLTADAGKLIPTCLIDCVPGDHFKIRQQALIRMQPMAAPLMETLTATWHFYFVPYRLLHDEFEDFITGGKEGTYEGEIPVFDPNDGISGGTQTHTLCAKGTLWDYFGFPTSKLFADAADELIQFSRLDKADLPIIFPWRAYNKIYNEYYRDENLQNEAEPENNTPLYRAWTKDYFTSALPWQQRGIAPSIPLSGSGEIYLTTSTPQKWTWTDHEQNNNVDVIIDTWTQEGGPASTFEHGKDDPVHQSNGGINFKGQPKVDVSQIATFDVADLRLITQIQKFMERNARGGVRYTEFLGQHFGVAPNDARLDRAEYIGGTKTTILVSEVLQTSESATTPQGNMSGKGLAAGDDYVGDYFVEEFGLIMGIMSITPRPKYQQGMNRHWTKRSRYDYYFPEFMNLSEQAIEEREIFVQESKIENQKVFGFQGRYDEYRVEQNSVHGDFRDILNYWHMGRYFQQAPNLNGEFIECRPTVRNFLVQDEPAYLVQLANIIHATRPMPYIAEPGLIDHN